MTKIFGAEILRRFLSDGLKEEMLENVDSLTAMMQQLEQSKGHPLAPTCYAILLDKAAAMKPDCLWAVWDFGSVLIEEVFDSEGRPNSDYGYYFDTLSLIYERTRDSRNRKRVFVFSDDEHEKRVKTHAGWKMLMQMHRDWGFTKEDVLFCKMDFLKGILTGLTAADMDDFVYFGVSGLCSHAWVIGFERDLKTARLRHGNVVIEDTERAFGRLFKDLRV